MKYIMFQHDIDGEPQSFPVIFPSNLVHKFVAIAMTACFEAHGIGATPVSAGEVSIFGTGVTCSGGSETLSLRARAEDAAIIHNHDYLFGIENPLMEAMLEAAKRKKQE